MKEYKKWSLALLLTLLVSMALGLGGCATTSDLEAVQVQVQKAMEQSERALREAESAQLAAGEIAGHREAAKAAATRAENAADRAEKATEESYEYTKKSEAILMKMMKK